MQRLAMRLGARRGSFPLQPDYGSRLWTLGRLSPSQRASAARQYIAEALRDEEGVEIESVDYTHAESRARIDLRLSVNGAAHGLSISV